MYGGDGHGSGGGACTSEYLFDHSPAVPTAMDDGAIQTLSYLSIPAFPPPPLAIPDGFGGGSELESVGCELGIVSGSGSTTGSGSNSGYSSYASPNRSTQPQQQQPSLIQRSVSSHSLHKNSRLPHQLCCPTADQFLDSELGSPVRRVFSTGDLQGINLAVQQSPRLGSPLSNETTASITTIEGLGRSYRYSPVEKKERIERYRSKRNQRNFNKKIQYACRKTLADSRPRIRGRFAKNDETDQKSSSETQWTHAIGEEEDDVEDDHWFSILCHALPPANHLIFPQR